MPDGGSLVVAAYKELIDSVEKDAQAEEKVAASRAQMAVRAARKK